MSGLHQIELGISGDVFTAEAALIFAAFTPPPTVVRKILINNVVVALKTAGVWTLLDVLYMFAAADSQAALINWASPGTYDGTLVNSPTFTADQGFTGANTKYIDSNFNPSTASSPKFIQDSAAIFAWATNDASAVGSIIGQTNGSIIAPHYVDDNVYARVNSGSNASIASTDSTGFWSVSRSGANLQTLYKNGSSIATDAGGSSAPENDKIVVLAGNSGNYWETGQCAAAGISSNLTGANNTALYNALRTYMTGSGNTVIILTAAEAQQVLGKSPTVSYAALEPVPLKDGTYKLHEDVLNDPAHADVHAILAACDVSLDTKLVEFNPVTDTPADKAAYQQAKLSYSDARARK